MALLSSESGWQLAAFALQALTYLSALLAAGGALFLVLFPRLTAAERGRIVRSTAAVAAVGIVAALLALPVRAGFLGGGGPAGMFDPLLLGMLAESTVGAAALLRLVGFGLLLGLLVPWRGALPLAIVGATLVLVSLTLTGHAAGVESGLIGQGLLLMHLLAAAYWLGALWPLLIVSRAADSDRAAAILERFGRLAGVLVGLLVLVGVALAALLLGSLGALWQTTYGVVLLLKLGLLVLLLGLAALNRFRLVPRLAAADPTAGGALQRSIGAEIALASGILLVTAVLTSYTSPFG